MPKKSLTVNRRNAYLHFFPEYNGKCKPGWVLHHKDPSWKYTDIKRYDEWRIEDLIPMTVSEHMAYHSTNDNIMHKAKMKDLMTPEEYNRWRHNISNGQKGSKHNYPEHRAPHSNKTKAKMSKTRSLNNRGKHWYNNGIKNTFAKFPLDDTWHLGRINAR